jgi:hypothetical protein
MRWGLFRDANSCFLHTMVLERVNSGMQIHAFYTRWFWKGLIPGYKYMLFTHDGVGKG